MIAYILIYIYNYHGMEPHEPRPTRRSIRLPSFDYAQVGQYFVTICCFRMHSIFGQVESNSVRLNVLGRIALDSWRTIPEHFSHVELEPFVVMPNHLHGILTIKDGHGCAVPLQSRGERFQHAVPGSIPTIIRSYKSAVTYLARQALGRPSLHVWQSNYFERVLRNGKEFSEASRYILENPSMWTIRRGTGHPCPS